MRRLLFCVLVAVSALSVACGDEGGAGAEHDHSGGGDHEHASEGTVPGAPADASEADRKITVVTLDELRFDPETIQVEVGEVVTFVIENEGSADHEFVLGDADYQHSHSEGMHDGGMMHEDNAVSVAPGETKELTWDFSEAGEVLYGCHEPGHYDGGMVGTIEVTS